MSGLLPVPTFLTTEPDPTPGKGGQVPMVSPPHRLDRTGPQIVTSNKYLLTVTCTFTKWVEYLLAPNDYYCYDDHSPVTKPRV